MEENQVLHKDKRHLARVLSVLYLYTYFISKKNEDRYEFYEPSQLLGILEERSFNKPLYEKLTEGVLKNIEKLDSIIKDLAPQWPLDQTNLVSLIILRMAIWEAFIGKITPEKVVINEAIELDKALSSKTTSSFVNGVLGKILNDEEFKKRTF